jgi:Amt family ammonium transporter
VAGLVAITPACGFVNLLGATIIGAAAGALCALAVRVKFKLKLDDSLDVIAVHFVGGAVGALLIGFLGTAVIGGKNGLFYGGNASLLGHQALGLVSVTAYSLVISTLIALAIKYTIGLRVSERDEDLGLDLSQHAESAYDLETMLSGIGSASTSESSPTAPGRPEGPPS